MIARGKILCHKEGGYIEMSKKKCYKIRDTRIFNLNMPSLIILSSVCMVSCLSSLSFMTWAWFTDTATTTLVIETGSYDMDIKVVSSAGLRMLNEISSHEYELNANQTYTITLIATGTAPTGFCQITIDGEIYYTEPILTQKGNNRFTFTIETFEDTKISFNPQWGAHDNKNNSQVIANGMTITIGAPPQIKEETVDIPKEPSIGELPDETITDSSVDESPEFDSEIPDTDDVETIIPPTEDITPELGENEIIDIIPEDNIASEEEIIPSEISDDAEITEESNDEIDLETLENEKLY